MKVIRIGLILLPTIFFSILISRAMPQSSKSKDTIWLGVDLVLGMDEDAAITKLTASNHKPRKMELAEVFRAKGITSMWVLNDGVLEFTSGKLVSVTKHLLEEGDEVEFGRQLFFAMRELEREGDLHCTIETEAAEVPHYSTKTAKLQCGKKSILVELQRINDQKETVQLDEGLTR